MAQTRAIRPLDVSEDDAREAVAWFYGVGAIPPEPSIEIPERWRWPHGTTNVATADGWRDLIRRNGECMFYLRDPGGVRSITLRGLRLRVGGELRGIALQFATPEDEGRLREWLARTGGP